MTWGAQSWELFATEMTQQGAQATCSRRGGNLVTLPDQTAAVQLRQWFLGQGVGYAWIGLSSCSGQPTTIKSQWCWMTTGQSPTYDFWSSNPWLGTQEPSNDGGNQGGPSAQHMSLLATLWLLGVCMLFATRKLVAGNG